MKLTQNMLQHTNPRMATLCLDEFSPMESETRRTAGFCLLSACACALTTFRCEQKLSFLAKTFNSRQALMFSQSHQIALANAQKEPTSWTRFVSGVNVDEVWAAHLQRRWPQTYQQTVQIFQDAPQSDSRQQYLEKHFHELLRFSHFKQHLGENLQNFYTREKQVLKLQH